VPTSDVNTTFALAITVWVLMIFFSIKAKGFGGWTHRVVLRSLRFASPAVAGQLPVQPDRIPVQAAFAFAAAVRQHVRRRIIFLLLWMWAANSSWTTDFYFGWIVSSLLALGWAIFHILIVALQAYVFMMLTVVYLAMAHEHH
jgi:F-type H+-transporting ATPase subunit a